MIGEDEGGEIAVVDAMVRRVELMVEVGISRGWMGGVTDWSSRPRG